MTLIIGPSYVSLFINVASALARNQNFRLEPNRQESVAKLKVHRRRAHPKSAKWTVRIGWHLCFSSWPPSWQLSPLGTLTLGRMVHQHRQPFAHWDIILDRQINMKSEVSLWLILDKLNQKSFGDGPDKSSKSSLDLCRITDWNIVLLYRRSHRLCSPLDVSSSDVSWIILS